MKSLKKATGWIIAGVAALLIIVTATSATTIVPAGHAGVVVTMGSVSNRVLDEGLHFKVPFVQQIVMMNNKIQKTEVASNSVSKDLQTISSSVAINFTSQKMLLLPSIKPSANSIPIPSCSLPFKKRSRQLLHNTPQKN